MLERAIVLRFACLAVAALPLVADCHAGDLDGDCRVDLRDFALLARWWRLECDASNGWCNGADLLRSGGVGLGNLAAFVSSWEPRPGPMVFIPGGTFQMGDHFNEGSAGERPVHEVTLSSFHMSRYEVTNGQYCKFLNWALARDLITVLDGIVYPKDGGTSQPYCDTSASSANSRIVLLEDTFVAATKGGRDMSNDPVVRVTWYGAAAFCNWLSEREWREPCYDMATWECDFGKDGYHLPTEAQWEYAARGGLSGKRFPWGDTITHDQANYFSVGAFGYDISATRGHHPLWNDGISPYTSPVGSFAANGYGLHDMTGNVLEWCNDWHGAYSPASQIDPTGPASGDYRVLRGSGWDQITSLCRVSSRHIGSPGNRNNVYGFRVCR